MTSTNDILRDPRLTFTLQEDGKTEARFSMNGFGADILCYYWPVREQGRDPWACELERINGDGGRYSRVSEHGCRIMIAKHLVAAGLIGSKEDNSHLDDRNREICAELVRARAALPEVPQVGDFVMMPDGTTERCAYGTAHGMQTCYGGSFYVFRNGRAEMGGSLNRPRLNEYFQLTQESKLGSFWFFSHNLPGAGRGVDVFLPCRVYRLAPFTMTEAEARAHPKAKRVAECWGENHRDHLAAIVALMEGRA